jgi:phage-related protein
LKGEIVITNPVANGLVTAATDLLNQPITNFLLAITFAGDSTHMEGLTRTRNDATWITNGIIQITTFHTAAGLNNPTTCVNALAPRRIVLSSVCDWNFIVTIDNHPYNGQYYATNTAFKI